MTKVQIDEALADWAKRFNLTEAYWTQDTSITQFSGMTPDGGYCFYAFAQIGRHAVLENNKIVSGIEVKSARLGCSPYARANAECYNELAARLHAERVKASPHAVEDVR